MLTFLHVVEETTGKIHTPADLRKLAIWYDNRADSTDNTNFWAALTDTARALREEADRRWLASRNRAVPLAAD